MIHKSENLFKQGREGVPFNHYATKCGLNASYAEVSFLWKAVTCKHCLLFAPIKATRTNRDKLSSERKDAIKKTYLELKKLRFNYGQMVLEMNRLGLKTQTGKEVTLENLKSFLYRNNL